MLSKDYIVGLTDGEGSFSVYIRPPHKRREQYTKHYTIACRYYIKMRQDELPLLKEVQKFFGCGSIYLQKDRRLNHQNCYRYEIGSIQKLWKLVIPFFKKNPLHSTSRKNDFEWFRRIVDIARLKKRKHLTEKEISLVQKYKSRMHK